MFRAWHEFYGLLGTAAATLVALLFVAASVGVGLLTIERAAGTRLYISPIILHYASVLSIRLVMLIPALGDRMLGAIVGLCGAVGLIGSVVSPRGCFATANRNSSTTLPMGHGRLSLTRELQRQRSSS